MIESSSNERSASNNTTNFHLQSHEETKRPRTREWTPRGARASTPTQRQCNLQRAQLIAFLERSRISVPLVPFCHGAIDDESRLVSSHQHHRARTMLQHAPLHQHVHHTMAGQPRPDIAACQTILQLPVAQQLCQQRADKIVVSCRAKTIPASTKHRTRRPFTHLPTSPRSLARSTSTGTTGPPPPFLAIEIGGQNNLHDWTSCIW
jgi:hypothetical protein